MRSFTFISIDNFLSPFNLSFLFSFHPPLLPTFVRVLQKHKKNVEKKYEFNATIERVREIEIFNILPPALISLPFFSLWFFFVLLQNLIQRLCLKGFLTSVSA